MTIRHEIDALYGVAIIYPTMACRIVDAAGVEPPTILVEPVCSYCARRYRVRVGNCDGCGAPL